MVICCVSNQQLTWHLLLLTRWVKLKDIFGTSFLLSKLACRSDSGCYVICTDKKNGSDGRTLNCLSFMFWTQQTYALKTCSLSLKMTSTMYISKRKIVWEMLLFYISRNTLNFEGGDFCYILTYDPTGLSK